MSELQPLFDAACRAICACAMDDSPADDGLDQYEHLHVLLAELTDLVDQHPDLLRARQHLRVVANQCHLDRPAVIA